MAEERRSAVRIDLAKGQVELEGSEDFLRQALVEVRDIITKARGGFAEPAQRPSVPPPSPERMDSLASSDKPKKASRRPAGTGAYVPPVPFDIRGDGKLSLPEFFKSKAVPKNHEKLITLITYWLNRHGGIQGVLPGHLMYAYQELGLEKPGNLYASLTNARSRSRTVVAGPEPGTIRVNHSGENFVQSLAAPTDGDPSAT